jgi:hypothetical protein
MLVFTVSAVFLLLAAGLYALELALRWAPVLLAAVKFALMLAVWAVWSLATLVARLFREAWAAAPRLANA